MPLCCAYRRVNKPLRVAEANTISNSGRDGVSNVLASALWTLDAAFETAAAGAVGINYHWGDGQSLYTAVVRALAKDGTLQGPIIKPPYYAYLMFQMAVASGSQFVEADLAWQGPVKPGTIKIWPVMDTKGDAMRVVVINKNALNATMVAIRVNRGWYGNGKLIRLSGPAGLSSRYGVRLAGVSLLNGGAANRTPGLEIISVSLTEKNGIWSSTYNVYMPAATAALLMIQKGPGPSNVSLQRKAAAFVQG
eukprot:jgi/Chrzof1/9149/Cz03g37210.t1